MEVIIMVYQDDGNATASLDKGAASALNQAQGQWSIARRCATVARGDRCRFGSSEGS